jgi:hypothetical protein
MSQEWRKKIILKKYFTYLFLKVFRSYWSKRLACAVTELRVHYQRCFCQAQPQSSSSWAELAVFSFPTHLDNSVKPLSRANARWFYSLYSDLQVVFGELVVVFGKLVVVFGELEGVFEIT